MASGLAPVDPLQASTIGLTWDTLGMPDLSNIVQFKIYIYGQGDPAAAGLQS